MQRLSLVPTKLYWKDNYVKLEFATAKGKKLHDKRQTEKERDQSRKLNKNKY
jgi:SsrA-binding protein